jgi:hypothetical protein
MGDWPLSTIYPAVLNLLSGIGYRVQRHLNDLMKKKAGEENGRHGPSEVGWFEKCLERNHHTR